MEAVTVHLFDVIVPQGYDPPLTKQWKARSSNGGALWWDLNRVCDSFQHEATRVDRLARQELAQWQVVWRLFGLNHSDAYLPSLKASDAQGQSEPADLTSSSHQVSTLGLLFVLDFWHERRRAHWRKELYLGNSAHMIMVLRGGRIREQRQG